MVMRAPVGLFKCHTWHRDPYRANACGKRREARVVDRRSSPEIGDGEALDETENKKLSSIGAGKIVA
jgi:hypothetical protein